MGITTNQYGVALFVEDAGGERRYDQKGLPPMNLMQARNAADMANDKAPLGHNYCVYNINAE